MKLAKNKRTLVIVGLVTASAIATSTLIIAHDGRGKHGGKFMKRHMLMEVADQIDVNQDGTITRQEMDAYRQQKLADHDTNQDNALQLAEFQPLWLEVMRSKMVDHFQHLDRDGDGRITDSELAEPLRKIMAYGDTNNDGALSRDELRFHHKRHGQGHHGGHDDDRDD